MLTKRTNIMLNKETWDTLVSLAKARQTTAGKLIRNAITQTYLKTSEAEVARRKVLIAHIKKIRVRGLGINYKEYINYGRKY